MEKNMISDLTHWLIKSNAQYLAGLNKQKQRAYNDFLDAMFKIDQAREVQQELEKQSKELNQQ